MRWSALAIVLLLGIVAAAAVIGTLLPREHRAVRSAEFHQDQGAIWKALTDFPALGRWMPGVQGVRPAGAAEGLPRWTLATAEGDLTIEVVESAEPERLVTRVIDTGQPFGGTWTYDIAAVEGATRVTITEDGWIRNPLYRFFARYVLGTARTMDDALRGLGNHFGETVLPRAG
jgi:carbon monoxide dehydrogenase subunit G